MNFRLGGVHFGCEVQWTNFSSQTLRGHQAISRPTRRQARFRRWMPTQFLPITSTGTTATDLSSNNYTGTLISSATWVP